MTTIELGRWLLVAVAVLGLAIAAPVVGAHGDGPAVDDAPHNGTTDGWATWMESHMTDHMGPGAVEWMESHTGATVDEMAQDMDGDDYDHMDGDAYDHMDGDDYGC